MTCSSSSSSSFSPALLSTLEVLFDTFLPSLPLLAHSFPSPSPSSLHHLSPSSSSSSSESPSAKLRNDDILLFFHLSASQLAVTSHAAELMSKRLTPASLASLKLLLWLLSSRLGTLLICGRHSLQWRRPPFLRRLAEIPPPEREHLLLSAWSHGSYPLLRAAFDAFKIFACYSFFTKVDKEGWNPAWNAIGYCGPDPAATAYRLQAAAASSPPERKPLEGGVLDAGALAPASLRAELECAGFEIMGEVSELKELWRRNNGGGAADAAEEEMGVVCDAVVVGSGCGGGVVAAVLAEAGFKVLVVEKGRYYARDDLSLLEGEALERLYENGGILPTASGSVLMLAGSTVGGGTAINWGASIPTPPNVLREWAEDHGISTFGKDGSFFDAMQTVLRRLGVDASSGGDIDPPPPVDGENLQNKALRCGCQRLGLRVVNVQTNSSPSPHHCGWCGFGCWSGGKKATSETWLVDAVATGNARIVADMTATCVLHRAAEPDNQNRRRRRRRRQAAGLVAWNAARRLRLFVSSRIVVAAGGALNSPVLLMRSGLQNPNIGKHLHIHPVQLVWGYFPNNNVNADVSSVPPPYEGATISAMCDELREKDRVILQCPSVHPGNFSVVTPWTSARDFRERMRRYARTAHVFVLVRDKGEGRVGRDGVVSYELDAEDEAALMKGAGEAVKVLAAAGAAEVGTNHRKGLRVQVAVAKKKQEEERSSSNIIEGFVKTVKETGIGAPLSSAHQMGSCRMGLTEDKSVVDTRGETWEVSGLFVADASLLPTAVGVNPMITIQSLALCIASHARTALLHLQP